MTGRIASPILRIQPKRWTSGTLPEVHFELCSVFLRHNATFAAQRARYGFRPKVPAQPTCGRVWPYPSRTAGTLPHVACLPENHLTYRFLCLRCRTLSAHRRHRGQGLQPLQAVGRYLPAMLARSLTIPCPLFLRTIRQSCQKVSA